LYFARALFLKGIENCFALMFGLTPNSGNASHPQPAFLFARLLGLRLEIF
jgi:hypothetical protein